jgi:arylsulfatase A-like enzyme
VTRPNIVFINTDQQTWDTIAAYGHPRVATPNMDRIVENGHSFMRSYSSDPVCAPTRSSWATGRYSSETGVPFNEGRLYEDLPDVGQILRSNGYRALHAGKWHVPGRHVRESFECLYFGKKDIPAGGAEFYDPCSVRAALDFLSRASEDQPFYLQVGLVDPHDVCEFEHGHEQVEKPDPVTQGLVTEEDLPPLPVNFNYDERETHCHQALRRGENPPIHGPIMRAASRWRETHWRGLQWQLERFISKVDVDVGLLLAAIDASPFRDNTLIIFAVDHGEAAGQHRLIQKFALYEESIRVPLVVASLGERFAINKNTRDTEHLVSGVDLLPTLPRLRRRARRRTDSAGGAFGPWWRGRIFPGGRYAYVESNCWGRALVGARWKYITEYRPEEGEVTIPGPDRQRLGVEQLFDLEADPQECRNLAEDPEMEPLLESLRSALLEQEGRLDRRPILEEGYGRRHMASWARCILDHSDRCRTE